MKVLKQILLIVIVLMLLFPAVQKRFGFIRSKSLSGVFSAVSKPTLSKSTWFNGSYQQQYRQYREDSTGFKPDFVRLYNQLDYSIFRIPHAERVIVGKGKELYASGYVRGYLGQDFPGITYIREKVRMLKYVQNYLAKNHHVFVVVVIPPDKGSLYPEAIPDRYLRMKRHETSRSYFVRLAKEAGINVLDFNPMFRAMKDTARYRLIPSSGVHWSDYGSFLAADSAVRYFKAKTGLTFPKLVLDSLEPSMFPRHNDDDINKTMNLIWPVAHDLLAYPHFHAEADTSHPKPAALFVADSFVWGWYDQPIIQNLFRNTEIWYYDKEIFPETFTKVKTTRMVNLRESVERQDILALLTVGSGSGNPGSGIIDRLFLEYDTSKTNPIRMMISQIKADPNWLNAVKKKYHEDGLTTDEMVQTEALILFNAGLYQKK